MQKCRHRRQQPSPLPERSVANVSDLAAQLSDDHLIVIDILNASRASQFATRGGHICEFL